jgi:anaerobic carbon-monoxide dehydrogenase iron sulfur subunit
MGKVLKASGMNKCIGCFSCMLACAAVNRKNHSIIKSAIKIQTYGGFRGKLFSTVCLGCTDERACREACPTGALAVREGGGVLLDEKTCIGCKKCVEACIANAVFFDEETKKPIIC